MDRSSKQKINKETQALNDTRDEIDLIDIYRTIHPKKQITFSSQGRIEHSPGEITSWVTSQDSVKLRKLKLYRESFLTTTL